MNTENKDPSLGRCVLAGLIAGAVAALLASLTAIVLARQFNENLKDLDWLAIWRTAMIACLVGSFFYGGLARWTTRPAVWLVIAGLVIAGVDSALVTTHFFSGAVGRIARDIVVLMTALILIPILAPALPQPGNKDAAKQP